VRRAFTSVEAARRAAKRRLPAAVYEYVDGGKEGDTTAAANERAFSRILFSPKVCTGITQADTSVWVLGRRIAMPLIIAPTGFIRIVHADGELGVARAAAAAGIPIAMSTVCGEPAGAVQRVNPDTWFQLYMLGGRDGARFSIDIARHAGCRVLVVTVDVAALTFRDRVTRPLPSNVSLRTCLAFFPEAWCKPRWLASFLRGGLTMRAPNAPRNADGSEMTLAEIGKQIVAAAPSWHDLEWIRRQWDGPLVVKGVLRVDDAHRAVAIGANAISVSNHGGKVLDGTPASVSVLPEVVDAVGKKTEVFLDGGVRRGADVVRACALGAKAVLIGRPYLWGLAAAGESGVVDVLTLFQRGTSATLAALGCPSIAEIDPTWLRPLPEQGQWNEIGASNASSPC
jgi:isopentenyl diphosphate isomerase/L-lactate dehydrogenase-like FMN-dependent dehydrogenase